MPKALDLSALMSTRLCHDLTGPISAINNGVELMQEMGGDSTMQEEALQLIVSSASEAARRLQFYRLAFGHLTGGEPASLLSRRPIMDGFFETTKVKLKFPEAMPPLRQKEIRLCLNLLLVASASLIRGGMISFEQQGSHELSLTASGASVRMDSATLAVLNGASRIEASDAKNVHLCFIHELLSDAHCRLEAQLLTDAQLVLRLQLAPQE